jgi:UPF0755 protein
MRSFLIILVALVIIAAGATEWAVATWNEPGPPAASGNVTVTLIQPHTRTHDIAEQLERAHLINYALVFEFDLHWHAMAGKVKAGEYAIPSHASMAEIAAILVSGKSIQHKLTAAEGLTSGMIFKLVVADPALMGDPGPEPADGTLLPETYLFTHGTTRAELLSRMRKAQAKFLDEKWASRSPDLPFQTKEQAVILASIVEKETSLPEERRHIAAVFVNRLKAGMKLQSDPTIIYGITRGYPLGRDIRESEILGDTPYNTYVIDGLPPTPICNPGKDSLAAVLDPETSSDLYFVATGQGGHVFATTMAEHDKNVTAYRAFLKLKEGGPPPVAAVHPKHARHRHV